MSGISVIIPVYNRENTIRDAVLSVLNQDIRDCIWNRVEVIVVDDGSNDSTLQRIKDLPVTIISTGGRKGACFARNLGVKNAQYDWVAFNDSDDIWLVNKLLAVSMYAKLNNYDVYFSSLIQYDTTSKKVTCFPDDKFKFDMSHILKKNFISTQTLVIKKDIFFEIGLFDETLTRFQDWDLAIRLTSRYKLGFISTPLVVAYVQTDSITKNYKNGLEMRKVFIKKYASFYSKYRLSYLRFILDLLIRQIVIIFK